MIKLNSIIEHNFTINNDFVVKIEKDEKSDLSCVSNYGQWKTKYGSFNLKSNLRLEVGEIIIIYPKKNLLKDFLDLMLILIPFC